MWSCGRLFGALLAAAGVCSCQTDQVGAQRPTTSIAAAPQATTKVAQPPLAAYSGSEPIEIVKTTSSLAQGSLVGISKSEITRCFGLRPYQDALYNWSDFLLSKHEKSFNKSFYDAAKQSGLDVVGDPRELFAEQSDRSRATFSVAADITYVRFDICDHMHWFLEYRLGKMSGNAEMHVDWHVYDKLQRKVIHKESTRGRFAQGEEPAEGAMTFVLGAFSDAARALAASESFRRVVAKSKTATGQETNSARLAPLVLLGPPAFSGQLAERAHQASLATVVIDLGDGHGSGFAIDRRGYIISNQHVVGERDRVRVRFADGIEAIGEVVRRDQIRDVALIKVPISTSTVLPIRSVPIAVAEEVYAIGAPIDRTLANTVTKGIVSALRRERNGQLYIQADVNVQSGNSGGPLVDKAGNVVGITTAGLRVSGSMTGINFFIPIHDALERLNVTLRDGPAS